MYTGVVTNVLSDIKQSLITFVNVWAETVYNTLLVVFVNDYHKSANNYKIYSFKMQISLHKHINSKCINEHIINETVTNQYHHYSRDLSQ